MSSSQKHKTRYPPPEHTCDPWIQQEIARYNPALPIEQAKTPPSTWYANSKMLDLELQSIFLDQWVAVDVVLSDEPGSYQTGCFAKQPYLLTRNEKGDLQAFYNVCTHAGSCLVGPWTTAGCSKLDTSLVGQSTHGNLFSSKLRGLQCPYHGWQFNLDGKLTKATNLKGIRDFSPKAYGLKAIPVEQLGPIVFLHFGSQEGATNGSRKQQEQHDIFISNRQLFSSRLEESGFHRDFGDLDLIESRQYTVQCNWKVVCDNYGDGCYHCSYAHQSLASNIDESNYSTQILSAEVSVQHAPPSAGASCSRFGTERAAVYAQWYPNIMFNRYGPWLDVDIIKPINESTSVVHKAWFLERNFHPPNEVTRDEYIRDSLESSRRVHEEDAFLCENAQLGMSSRGFDRSRYVPSKQIAAQHFHQRLAIDLQRAARWNSI
jgi:choline monooxygenase